MEMRPTKHYILAKDESQNTLLEIAKVMFLTDVIHQNILVYLLDMIISFVKDAAAIFNCLLRIRMNLNSDGGKKHEQ